MFGGNHLPIVAASVVVVGKARYTCATVHGLDHLKKEKVKIRFSDVPLFVGDDTLK